MKRRLISFMLVIAMIVSMLPVTAFAADPEGVKTFDELKTAIAADGTVTLGGDITATSKLTVPAGKTVTLDLAGHTVTMVYTTDITANHEMILNKGNLTIQDSVGGGKLSYKYTGANVGTSYSANTITSDAGSTLTVKGGTIENLTYDSGTIAYAIDGLTNGGIGDVTVNIEGGIITSLRQSVRIFANSTTCTGTLNISGGDITGRVIVQNANASANKAALEITGGTFNVNAYKTEVLSVGGNNGATIAMTPVVSGGTFNGEIISVMTTDFITGGTFSTDVSEFVAPDCNYDPTTGTVTAPVTIDYVSLGASNTNGYGHDGYLPDAVYEDPLAASKADMNTYGYLRAPETAYPTLIAEALKDFYGVDDVELHQLAISSMRVEELRVLLDDEYYGDAYTEWRFTGGQNWFGIAEPGGLEALRAAYQNAVKDAEVITVDMGWNNFGVFAFNNIKTILADGNYWNEPDPDLLKDLGEQINYKGLKDFARNYLENSVGLKDEALLKKLDKMADVLAYAALGACYHFDIVMEKIYEANPDAQVVVLSIQNLADDLVVNFQGTELKLGDLYGKLIEMVDHYRRSASPYAEKYMFANAGDITTFLDEIVAWDGDPTSLGADMKDCFDMYDDSLYVRSIVEYMMVGQALSAVFDGFRNMGTGYSLEVFKNDGKYTYEFALDIDEDKLLTLDLAALNLADPGKHTADSLLSNGWEKMGAAYETYNALEVYGAAVAPHLVNLRNFEDGGKDAYNYVFEDLLENLSKQKKTLEDQKADLPTGTSSSELDAGIEKLNQAITTIVPNAKTEFTKKLEGVYNTYVNTLNYAYDVVATFVQYAAKIDALEINAASLGGFNEAADGLIEIVANDFMGGATEKFTYELYANGVQTLPDENIPDEEELLSYYVPDYVLDESAFDDAALRAIAVLAIRYEFGNSFFAHPNVEGNKEITAAVMNALEKGTTAKEDTLADLEAAWNWLVDYTQTNYPDAYDVLVQAAEYVQTEEFATLCAQLKDLYEKADAATTPEEKQIIFSELYNMLKGMQEIVAKVTYKKLDLDKIDYYVSLGDSTISGYGLEGYEDGVLNGAHQVVTGSAHVLLAQKLFGDEWKSKFANLCQGSLRADDLLLFLGGDVELDDYYREEIKGNLMAEDKTLESTQKEFIENVEKADLISVAIGGGNFLTFAGKYVNRVVGTTEGEPYELDWGRIGLDTSEKSMKELEEALDTLVYNIDAMGLMDDILPAGVEIEDPAKFCRALVEGLLYGYASYSYYYTKVLDRIQEINPDAHVLVPSMFNPVDDWKMTATIEGEEVVINIGGIVAVMLESANLQPLAYALQSKFQNQNVTYVDVHEAETILEAENPGKELGFNDYYNSSFQSNGKAVHASVNGHKYIADQFYTAITTDYTIGDMAEDVYEGVVDLVERYDLFNKMYALFEQYGPEILNGAFSYVEEHGYIEQLEAAVEALKADLEAKTKEFIKTLEPAIKEQIKALEAELEALEAELNDLYKELTAKKAELEALLNKAEADASAAVKQAIATLEAVIEEIEATIAKVEAAIKLINEQIEVLKAKLEAIEAELKELAEVIAVLEDALKDLVDFVMNPDAAIEAVMAKKAKLEKAINDAIAQIEALEDQLIAKKAELEAAVKAEIAELEAAIVALKAELEAAIAAGQAELVAQLEAQIAALEAELAAKKAELEAAINAEIAKIEAQIAAVKATLALKQAALTALVTAEIAEIKAELIEKQAELKAAVEAGKTKLIAKLEKQIAALENELAAKLAELKNNVKEQLAEIDSIAEAYEAARAAVLSAINAVDAAYKKVTTIVSTVTAIANDVAKTVEDTYNCVSNALKNAYDTLPEAIDAAINAQLSALEAELAALKAEVEAAIKAESDKLWAAVEGEIAELEAAIAAKLAELEAAVGAANAELAAQISAQIAALEAELAAKKAELEAAVKAVSDKLWAAAEGEIAKLEAAIAAKNAELAAAIDAVKAEIESQIAALQAELAAKKAELEAAINAEIAELEAAIAAKKAELEAAIAAGQAELIAQIEAQIAALEAELAAKKAELEAAVKAEIAELEAQVAAQIEALKNKLEAEIAAINAEIGAQIQALENQLAALKTEVETAVKAEVAKIEAALKAEIAELEAAIAAKKAELEAAIGAANAALVAQITAQIEALENQLAALKAEVEAAVKAATDKLWAAVEEEIAKLEAAIAAKKAELEAAVKAEIEAQIGALIEALETEVKTAIETVEAMVEKAAQEALAAAAKQVGAVIDFANAKIDEIIGAVEDAYVGATTDEYEVGADSYYVALGDGSAVSASYVDKVAAALEVPFKNLAVDGQTIGKAPAHIVANAAEIQKADLITVGYGNNTFAQNAFDRAVSALLGDPVETYDWVALIGAEGAAYVEQTLADIKADLVASGMDVTLTAYGFETDLASAVTLAVEAYAYATVEYLYALPTVIGTIREINPDAVVAIVGMYNPMDEVTLTFEDVSINIGEYLANLVEGADMYGTGFCMLFPNAIYVSAPDAETAVTGNDYNMVNFLFRYMNGRVDMDPNDAGHEYIYQQIMNALTVTEAPVEATLLGDVNLDGVVDANDLTALARHVARIEYLTDAQALANAEVTGNDDINADDLTHLARYIARIIPSL